MLARTWAFPAAAAPLHGSRASWVFASQSGMSIFTHWAGIGIQSPTPLLRSPSIRARKLRTSGSRPTPNLPTEGIVEQALIGSAEVSWGPAWARGKKSTHPSIQALQVAKKADVHGLRTCLRDSTAAELPERQAKPGMLKLELEVLQRKVPVFPLPSKYAHIMRRVSPRHTRTNGTKKAVLRPATFGIRDDVNGPGMGALMRLWMQGTFSDEGVHRGNSGIE
ncbi:hypothetical protein CMUS01_00113 [Colletotrichum musicola]|uniref:Uncharacterized protein n=1 Tax=Colletotrichum musicola TaxID=2175873 RepID=A0A8H6NZ79_9PEZI|nr:hypothetical protein CMUS01_00113 [Colletotrichum musicola]